MKKWDSALPSEEEDALEPLSYSSDGYPPPYSVMSLFSKMPLEEPEQQEGRSSVGAK